MLAFSEDKNRIREVTIPDTYEDTNKLLDLVFKFGQNDFQPQKIYSVSCGDVVEYKNKYYMVCSVGFKKITKEQFDNLTPPTSFLAFSDDLEKELENA